jgi:hypothetical protein
MRTDFISFAPTVNKLFLLNQSLVPFQKNVMKMRDFFPQRKSYFNFFHLILTKPARLKRRPRNFMMQGLL